MWGTVRANVRRTHIGTCCTRLPCPCVRGAAPSSAVRGAIAVGAGVFCRPRAHSAARRVWCGVGRVVSDCKLVNRVALPSAKGSPRCPSGPLPMLATGPSGSPIATNAWPAWFCGPCGLPLPPAATPQSRTATGLRVFKSALTKTAVHRAFTRVCHQATNVCTSGSKPVQGMYPARQGPGKARTGPQETSLSPVPTTP